MGRDSTIKFIGLDVHSKTISVAIAVLPTPQKFLCYVLAILAVRLIHIFTLHRSNLEFWHKKTGPFLTPP